MSSRTWSTHLVIDARVDQPYIVHKCSTLDCLLLRHSATLSLYGDDCNIAFAVDAPVAILWYRQGALLWGLAPMRGQ